MDDINNKNSQPDNFKIDENKNSKINKKNKIKRSLSCELKDISEKSVLVFYMKIHWKNGRVDIVPLMNDELVDIKKSGDNLDYTITLRSGASHAENMADIIHINKKN